MIDMIVTLFLLFLQRLFAKHAKQNSALRISDCDVRTLGTAFPLLFKLCACVPSAHNIIEPVMHATQTSAFPLLTQTTLTAGHYTIQYNFYQMKLITDTAC